MTAGHVFVVRGRIGTMVADAAVISTDARFPGRGLLARRGVSGRTVLCRGAPSRVVGGTRVGRSPARESVWFVDVTAEVRNGGDGSDVPNRARELEIFLDAVAMHASSNHSWLLDERFSYLHQNGNEELAVQARKLADSIRDAATLWDGLGCAAGAVGGVRGEAAGPRRRLRTSL
jgi:hypothetical protein